MQLFHINDFFATFFTFEITIDNAFRSFIGQFYGYSITFRAFFHFQSPFVSIVNILIFIPVICPTQITSKFLYLLENFTLSFPNLSILPPFNVASIISGVTFLSMALM